MTLLYFAMWWVFAGSKRREVANLISMEIDLKEVLLSCETIQKMRSAKISFACHCHVQLILHLTHNKRHSGGDILAPPKCAMCPYGCCYLAAQKYVVSFTPPCGIFLPLSA
jgi:hypothetical protein